MKQVVIIGSLTCRHKKSFQLLPLVEYQVEIYANQCDALKLPMHFANDIPMRKMCLLLQLKRICPGPRADGHKLIIFRPA